MAKPAQRHAWVFVVVLLLLAAGAPGCGKASSRHEKGGGGNGPGGGGAPAVPPGGINILDPGTATHELFDASHSGFTVGPDGFARLVYLRIVDSNFNGIFENGVDQSQVMYVRQRVSGTWTTPLALSGLNTDFKDNPQIVVVNTGPNTGVTFAFWAERVDTANGILRFSRVNAADPPLVLTGGANGIIISDQTAPVGIQATSIVGGVRGFTESAALDTIDGSVYCAWHQVFDDIDTDGVGGPDLDGPPDECVIVGRYAQGGAGTGGPATNDPDEKFALTVEDEFFSSGPIVNPGAGWPLQLVFSPTPLVGTGGTMHAVYLYNDLTTGRVGVLSRTRTAALTWTPGPPGDVVSDLVADVASYGYPYAAVDAAGGLYVTWAQATPPAAVRDAVHHAYRPAVGPFDPSVVAAPAGPAPTVVRSLAIALDGTIPVIAIRRQDAAGGTVTASAVVGTAAASGPFAAETILHPATATAPGELLGFVRIVRENGSGRMAIVYDVPAAAAGPLEVFGVVRPSGGPFGPEALISRPLASPPILSRLAGSAPYGATEGRIAFVQGPDAGPRELWTIHYIAGVFDPAANLSNTTFVDSHGEFDTRFLQDFVGVFGQPAGISHLWWAERLGANQDDLFYQQQ